MSLDSVEERMAHCSKLLILQIFIIDQQGHAIISFEIDGHHIMNSLKIYESSSYGVNDTLPSRHDTTVTGIMLHKFTSIRKS